MGTITISRAEYDAKEAQIAELKSQMVGYPSCSTSTSPAGRRNTRRSFWTAFPGFFTQTAIRAIISCRESNREPSEAGRGWKGGARERA